ncbi:MAG: hypothetical protein K8R21_06870 [Leptospira sp.]|nr:hypothetical protein [Leptospira sp.]
MAEIIPRTGASEALLIDDIIIEFGGMKIDSKGYFDHPEFGKQSLSFLSNCGEEFGFIAGKTIPVKLLRNKKEISVHMPLRIFPYDSIRIPYANNGGKPPVYLIKSGFIFLELSEFLLREWGNNWRTRVDRKLLYLTDYHKLHRGKETGKIVLLAQVLPDDSNNGYHGLSFKIVESVNGEAIASVPDLNRRILSSKENLALISLESGIEIVIDKSKSDEIDRKIMEKFRINKLKNF